MKSLDLPDLVTELRALVRPIHSLSSGSDASRHVHKDVILSDTPVSASSEHEKALLLVFRCSGNVIATSRHVSLRLELLGVRVDGRIVEGLQEAELASDYVKTLSTVKLGALQLFHSLELSSERETRQSTRSVKTHVPEARNQHCALRNDIVVSHRERLLDEVRNHDDRRTVAQYFASNGVGERHLFELFEGDWCIGLITTNSILFLANLAEHLWVVG